MNRAFIVALGLGLALVASAPSGASSSKAPAATRCSGTWTSGRDVDMCGITYRGGPVVVQLNGTGAPVGFANVRLEKPAPGVPPTYTEVVAQCSAAGATITCSGRSLQSKDVAPVGSQLICIVVSRAAQGDYACSTGNSTGRVTLTGVTT